MIGTVLVRLVRTGLRKGLFEGSRPWLAVGLGAGALAVARRLIVQPPKTLFSSELQAGDAFEIRAVPPNR